MSVEQPDVIDFVVHNPKTNEVMLVMVEVRPGNEAPQILQLQAKFRCYAEFVMSGALVRQYPDLADRPLSIRLDHFAAKSATS